MCNQNKICVEQLHLYAWLLESLDDEESFIVRTMFGTKAIYLEGKLLFCFATKTEPWRGVLIATSRHHHASLTEEIPVLSPHPLLAKWLYLSDSSHEFEKWAKHLIRLAQRRDLRIGVFPKPKRIRSCHS